METENVAPSEKRGLVVSFPSLGLMGALDLEEAVLATITFKWREIGTKRRLIGIPNEAMKDLHKRFKVFLDLAVESVEGMGSYKNSCLLKDLPSATGGVAGSNHFVNASKHQRKQHFYITDFARAYQSLDLERLTTLLVFIFRYEYYRVDYTFLSFVHNTSTQATLKMDPLYESVYSFVRFAFGGRYGEGLAIGGPLSTQLLNLYCEAYLDVWIREYCQKKYDQKNPDTEIVYTRFVDDLVFSSDRFLFSTTRKELRKMIGFAGFSVNHRKSRVLSRGKGGVKVTKVGLEGGEASAVISFPKKKRKRLEHLVKTFLIGRLQEKRFELISGVMAEFLYYYKQVTPTKSDCRTKALCERFKKETESFPKLFQNRRKNN